jgi:hypothetical protein
MTEAIGTFELEHICNTYTSDEKIKSRITRTGVVLLKVMALSLVL